MRKRVFGRKLKRTTNQRKALFKSLTHALVLHGRIKTTEAKAKSIKGEVEKLITYAKNNEVNAFHHLQKKVAPSTAEGIIANIAPLFKDRPGGYTRIVRIGSRKKDNATMVLLELVEKMVVSEVITPKKVKVVKEVETVKSEAAVETPKKAVKKEVKKASKAKKAAK